MQMQNTISFMGTVVSQAKVSESKNREYVQIYMQNTRHYNDGNTHTDSAPVQFSGDLAEQFLEEINSSHLSQGTVVLINGCWSSNSYQTDDGNAHTSYRIQAFDYYILADSADEAPAPRQAEQRSAQQRQEPQAQQPPMSEASSGRSPYDDPYQSRG
jgi:single-stranded DNA-binding protein